MGVFREQGHFGNAWFAQVLSIFGCLASTAVIAALLFTYDNKPIFDRSGITLNALVSVFSTFSKAFLAFTVSECVAQSKWIWLSWQRRPVGDVNYIDYASRGPLGSTKLLFKPAARSFITFGALVIILSSVIDPLTQLVIGNEVRTVFTHGEATIMSGGRYSKGTHIVESGMILGELEDGFKLSDASADFPMQSAMLSGLSQDESEIIQQANHFCPSGNCTYDPFLAMSACSACNDVTGRLVGRNKGVADLQVTELMPSTFTAIGNITEFSLPNGLLIGNAELAGKGPVDVLMVGRGTANRSETLTFKYKDTLFWSMSFIKANDATGDWPKAGVQAVECGMWLCVNNYTYTVQGGKVSREVTPANSERVLESWQLRDGGESPTDATAFVVPYSSEKRTDLTLGAGFNISDVGVYGIGSSLEFTMTNLLNATGLASRLEQFFNPNVSINGFVAVASQRNYRPAAMEPIYNGLASDDPAAPFVVTAGKRFAALAESISNRMRADSDEQSQLIGRTGQQVVFIQVRWVFLALPVALDVAGAIFLVLVIVRTRMAHIPVWTTDLHPLLAKDARRGDKIDRTKQCSALHESARDEYIEFADLKAVRWPEDTKLVESKVSIDSARTVAEYETAPPPPTHPPRSSSWLQQKQQQQQQQQQQQPQPPPHTPSGYYGTYGYDAQQMRPVQPMPAEHYENAAFAMWNGSRPRH